MIMPPAFTLSLPDMLVLYFAEIDAAGGGVELNGPF